MTPAGNRRGPARPAQLPSAPASGPERTRTSFGAGLGVRDTISSPSFVLMGEYAGRLPLFHIDLYRLATARDVVDAGLLDDRQAAGVVLIEWPDRLGETLPVGRLDVRIDGGADEPRTLRLEAHGDVGQRYLSAADAVRASA